MSTATGALRYGIIGTGMMGCEHIMNIALLDDAFEVADQAEAHPGVFWVAMEYRSSIS